MGQEMGTAKGGKNKLKAPDTSQQKDPIINWEKAGKGV